MTLDLKINYVAITVGAVPLFVKNSLLYVFSASNMALNKMISPNNERKRTPGSKTN